MSALSGILCLPPWVSQLVFHLVFRNEKTSPNFMCDFCNCLGSTVVYFFTILWIINKHRNSVTRSSCKSLILVRFSDAWVHEPYQLCIHPLTRLFPNSRPHLLTNSPTCGLQYAKSQSHALGGSAHQMLPESLVVNQIVIHYIKHVGLLLCLCKYL